jgi:hypothetical protein
MKTIVMKSVVVKSIIKMDSVIQKVVLFGIWLLVLGSPLASWGEEGMFRYQITSKRCKVYRFADQAWQPIETPPIGTIFEGRPFSKGKGSTVAKAEGTIFLYSDKCINRLGNAENRSMASTPAGALGPSSQAVPSDVTSTSSVSENQVEAAAPLKSSFYVLSSLFSWQEGLSLSDPNQNSYNLLATTVGGAIGARWQKPLNRHFELSLGGNILFGKSEVAEQSGETRVSTIRYRTKDATVYGFKLVPSFYYTMNENSAIGISIPVIYRVGDWPTPSNDYQLTPLSSIAPAFELSTKWINHRFTFEPKLGFYRTFSSLYWTIELGFRI